MEELKDHPCDHQKVVLNSAPKSIVKRYHSDKQCETA